MSDAPYHHLIKKYSNRKLYDTYTRRYITLEDIARLVRDGGNVTVVQGDTGEDVPGEVEKRVGDVESLVDGALERALKRLNIPTRRDVTRLVARIDALE